MRWITWRQASPEQGRRALWVMALLVVHPPDLVVDVLSGKEGSEVLFVVPAVAVKHLPDAAFIGSVDLETADGAGDVPVDRSSERVLEVVPDQTAGGASRLRSQTSPCSAWVGRLDSKTVVRSMSRRSPSDTIASRC